MIKPLGDRVVAERAKEAAQTASGIYLGEASEKPQYAVISAVGPAVETVKVGDKVVFKEYVATEIKLDGHDYLVVKEEDLLATI